MKPMDKDEMKAMKPSSRVRKTRLKLMQAKGKQPKKGMC